MKIIPLGCGSAFTMKDFQTNLLVDVGFKGFCQKGINILGE